MYLFCDNKDCKYHDPEINRCRENNHDCPYQKELMEKENKSDVTETIIKPLFNAIDLENSQCEPVEMPTIPKHNNNYVIGRNREQSLKNFSIKVFKPIAKIKFLGTALVIDVPDNCKGFIKPTKRQIKNLKKHFCIDVELMDEVKND